MEQFPAFDEPAIRHALVSHSVHASAPWEEWRAAAQKETIALDGVALSRFRARTLLAECDEWPREGFMEAWAESMPPGASAPDAEHLAGLAVVIDPTNAAGSADEPVLRALPLTSLPHVAKARFQTLFGVKHAWTMAELTPYVADLLEPGSAASKLVLQHARSVVANDGSVSYVSR